MIDIGIPNLSTPAAIIDRIIIEKLKIKEFEYKENKDLLKQTEIILGALQTQLNRILTQTSLNGLFLSTYNSLLIDLTIAVNEVSYFENKKALEHKNGNAKDNAYISHMDLLSRAANEKRSLYKKQIDELFKINFGVESLEETRTF